MSPEPSTILATNQDSFSDGALEMTFDEQCIPLRFETEDPSDFTEVTADPNDLEMSRSDWEVWIKSVFGKCGEGEMETISAADEQRIICHAIVHRLPDFALEEAMDTLAYLRNYYEIRPTAPARPEETEYLKGTITGYETAPIIPFLGVE